MVVLSKEEREGTVLGLIPAVEDYMISLIFFLYPSRWSDSLARQREVGNLGNEAAAIILFGSYSLGIVELN